MINLLPPKAKEQLRYDEYNRRVMFFGELGFLLALFFTILLFAEVLFAQAVLRRLILSTDEAARRPEARETSRIQKEVRLLKNDIERMRRLQERRLPAYETIRDFTALLSPSVRLTALDADLAGRKIVFSGTAPSRADLLALRDALEREKTRYGNVYLPLANLLKESDIPFTFSLTLLIGMEL